MLDGDKRGSRIELEGVGSGLLVEGAERLASPATIVGALGQLTAVPPQAGRQCQVVEQPQHSGKVGRLVGAQDVAPRCDSDLLSSSHPHSSFTASTIVSRSVRLRPGCMGNDSTSHAACSASGRVKS